MTDAPFTIFEERMVAWVAAPSPESLTAAQEQTKLVHGMIAESLSEFQAIKSHIDALGVFRNTFLHSPLDAVALGERYRGLEREIIEWRTKLTAITGAKADYYGPVSAMLRSLDNAQNRNLPHLVAAEQGREQALHSQTPLKAQFDRVDALRKAKDSGPDDPGAHLRIDQELLPLERELERELAERDAVLHIYSSLLNTPSIAALEGYHTGMEFTLAAAVTHFVELEKCLAVCADPTQHAQHTRAIEAAKLSCNAIRLELSATAKLFR